MRAKPRFLAVAEAARELGITPSTLRALNNTGYIPCVRGAYNYRMFDPDVIAAEKKRREAKRAVLSRYATPVAD